MKKKKSLRSQAKYPALDPKLNLKTRGDLLDIDYVDKLPQTWTDPKTGKTWTQEQLKQYLNDFNNEYVNADFKTNEIEGRKRIHKKKKSEHPKNEKLKEFNNKLLNQIKQIVDIINISTINIQTKHRLKRLVRKFKISLKKQIKDDFKFLKDTYKKKCEDANNARNNDIYTTSKAQGKLYLGANIQNTTKIEKGYVNIEDEIIENIDSTLKNDEK